MTWGEGGCGGGGVLVTTISPDEPNVHARPSSER
jgi:hypothetical protein